MYTEPRISLRCALALLFSPCCAVKCGALFNETKTGSASVVLVSWAVMESIQNESTSEERYQRSSGCDMRQSSGGSYRKLK